MRWPVFALLALAACAANPEPLNLSRFETPAPEFGLTRGPDGYYLARQSGPFATPAPSEILRFPFDGGPAEPAAWAQDGTSEYDFSWSARYRRGCFVRDLRQEVSHGDILCMDWTGTGWSKPEQLPLPVNTPGYEASPDIAPDGSLYFASMREGGMGRGDIYRATQEGSVWQVEMLGPAINSPTGEWNLAISPDGTMMVFEASGRETNRTVPGDLYLSCRVDGQWQPAAPMHMLNTDGSDLDFRFTGAREGIFSTSIDGDVVLRRAGPENFVRCE